MTVKTRNLEAGESFVTGYVQWEVWIAQHFYNSYVVLDACEVQYVKASMVTGEHIDPSLCQLFHEKAITEETSNPKSVYAACIFLMDIRRFIQHHESEHLQVPFGHRWEYRVVRKLTLWKLCKL